MEETLNFIEDVANFTSAGTSRLSIHTSKGVEQVEIENLSRLDSDYKTTELGRLYEEYPEAFVKIQKVTFRDQYFFNCYFYNDEKIDILKFNSEGELISDSLIK